MVNVGRFGIMSPLRGLFFFYAFCYYHDVPPGLFDKRQNTKDTNQFLALIFKLSRQNYDKPKQLQS